MGERIHVWGNRNTNGVEFFRELTEGETWFPYPGGNGIIVCHPDRPPVWCHMDADSFRQDYISGIQTPTEFIPNEPYVPPRDYVQKTTFDLQPKKLNPLPGPQADFMNRPFTATERKQLFDDGLKRLTLAKPGTIDGADLIPGPSYHEQLGSPADSNGVYEVTKGKW